jgi:hypothetical protein
MFMLRRFVSTAPLFVLALLFANPALIAQLSTQATINGTVTDPGGAVVPGASVTITNNATKVATVTQTNSSGSYLIPNLNVGTYSVSISKAGFKAYTVTDIELHPTETSTVNGTLAVGSATETVTVEATSAFVELSTPENSAYISGADVSSLPMNGRNYSALAGLLPGVINTSQGADHRRSLDQRFALHQRDGNFPQLLCGRRNLEREHRQHDPAVGDSKPGLD